MERWRRAFAENDKDFKELFGVKKEIFLQMHDILTAAALKLSLRSLRLKKDLTAKNANGYAKKGFATLTT